MEKEIGYRATKIGLELQNKKSILLDVLGRILFSYGESKVQIQRDKQGRIVSISRKGEANPRVPQV